VGAETGLRGALEQCFAPLTYWLGWRLEFPWSRYTDWAARSGVRLIERRPMPPFGHFSLIRFAKEQESAALPLRREVRATG
jgi:phosphatidylethanolamine/phosphatidyl-N-methylethanolamine N-methyltransferase